MEPELAHDFPAISNCDSSVMLRHIPHLPFPAVLLKITAAVSRGVSVALS